MTVTAIPSGGSAPAPAATTPRNVLSSDFDTFLKMMTTQMRNQNPLNPMDSSDFAVQLATFSGVEQQVRTNELLGELRAQFGQMGMAQIAGWVGMEARVTSTVAFDGQPVELQLPPSPGASRAELVVTGPDGRESQRIAIAPGETLMQWAGVRADGTPFARGSYDFAVESYAGDTLLDRQAVETYARITEVRRQGDNIVLTLASGNEILAGDVSGLRTAR